MLRALRCAFALMLGGCSLVVSTDEECETEADCRPGQSCSENLCIGAVEPCDSDLDCPSARGLCEARVCIERPVISVTEGIDASTTWGPANDYILENTIVVSAGTLEIEAGTRVYGRDNAALIVLPPAQLRADGNADAPIVFTSIQDKTNRRPGDWAGVALLGTGTINDPGGVAALEGEDPSDDRFQYGQGVDTPGADATCGFLRYVRIEFAGDLLFQNDELNGLTLAGCGGQTTLRYIQVHQGLDDGIEFFGGNASLKWAVISQANDDGLDWDKGWSGDAQFIVIQQRDADDNGIEANNGEVVENAAGEVVGDTYDALPRSSPRIYNLTITGGLGRSGFSTPRGMLLRGGTAGTIVNSIIVGHRGGGLQVGDVEDGRVPSDDPSQTCAVASEDPGPFDCPRTAGGAQTSIDVRSAVFADLGTPGEPSTVLTSTGAEEGFDITTWAQPSSGRNVEIRFDLVGTQVLVEPYNLAAPNFRPVSTGPFVRLVEELAELPPGEEFFESDARYLGAVAPPATELPDWTLGWTSFAPAAPPAAE